MSAVWCVGERLGEIIGRLKRSKFPEVSLASLNETSTAAFLPLEPLLLKPLLLEPLLLKPLLLEPLLLDPPLLHPPYKYMGLTCSGWFIDYPGLPGSQPPLRTHRTDVREGIAWGRSPE